MIKLTRLGGEEFLLNAELIRYVESRPDTFITLVAGDRVVVEEPMDEVLRRTVEYQRSKQMVPLTGVAELRLPAFDVERRLRRHSNRNAEFSEWISPPSPDYRWPWP